MLTCLILINTNFKSHVLIIYAIPLFYFKKFLILLSCLLRNGLNEFISDSFTSYSMICFINFVVSALLAPIINSVTALNMEFSEN